ncbi:TIGR03089 family protein [Arcanobacterium ihumii]|uniref:TIGR03089 family protein n=1 Tax=Arcanobacterium ihumii TaxID=2138162 RepID=UPI000F544FB0|nr:TIGR03089 family protein [Arcanobacterium ihumii]
MRTPQDIYAKLVSSGTTPALVWYEPFGRIELSAKVVANHVAKIANFLSEECEVVPSSQVLIDLPPHWKTVVWTLAALICGAEVRFISEPSPTSIDPSGHNPTAATLRISELQDADPDAVVITSSPCEVMPHYSGNFCVALTMSSLGLQWDGEALPSGVYDGAAEVLGYPDALLVAEDSSKSNFELLAHAAPRALHNALDQRNGEDGSYAYLLDHACAKTAFAFSYTLFNAGITAVVNDGSRKTTADIASDEKAEILNF